MEQDSFNFSSVILLSVCAYIRAAIAGIKARKISFDSIEIFVRVESQRLAYKI